MALLERMTPRRVRAGPDSEQRLQQSNEQAATRGRPKWVSLGITAAAVIAATVALALLFPEQRQAARETVAGWLGLGSSSQSADQGPRPTPVILATAKRDVATERFETSGRIEPAEDVALTSEVAGRVTDILVEDSARVETDQIILRFDNDDEKARVNAAEAALAAAQADLRRARELVEEDVAAEARLEDALSRERMAEADLSSARVALEDRVVRAPFTGQIGFIAVSPGAYVAPGTEIARLTTADRLRIRFQVPQALSEAVEDAGAVAVMRDGTDCGRAEILTFAPRFDPMTRTREVEARAPDGVCMLRPGGFVAVAVPTARREGAVFVPHASLRREGFESWVFRAVERNGAMIAERVPVTPGVVDGARIEIREGLEAGAQVVAEGASTLTDGAPIRPSGGETGGEGSRRPPDGAQPATAAAGDEGGDGA
jgi:membrane fusion protein (multidrug efflux system)